MRNYRLSILCLFLLSASALATPVRAQSAPTPRTPAEASEHAAVSALPTSDGVVVFNLRRLLTEALPRVLPAGSDQHLDAYLGGLKLILGADLRLVNSIALGIKMPESAVSRREPAFSLTVHGSFNAGQVISDLQYLFRQSYPQAIREEQHRGRRIVIFDVQDFINPPGSTTLMSTIDLSLTELDANIIAVGRLADVKRTVDANDGYGQISPALVRLATLRPKAIVSFAALEPEVKEPAIITAGMQTEGDWLDTLDVIKEASAFLELNEAGLELSMFARARRAAQTPAMRKALVQFVGLFGLQVKDPRIKGALDGLRVEEQGDEVRLSILLPQKAIASYISDWQSRLTTDESPLREPQLERPDLRRRPARKQRRRKRQ
ncbi:MAG TPA: hypothetical protein VD861_11675 [Pyrinomonadaceae bacterium]|nr:hypothetical protein [Pyrinomonadaceae bacterium]